MHVIISLDDQPGGEVSVKTLVHPVIVGDGAQATPATQLGDFLMKAVEVWQATRNMDMPEALAFVRSVTVTEPSEVNHGTAH